MSVIPLHEARADREAKNYRDALRAANDIARRALRGEGESRFNALSSIDRITATALRENP